MNRSPLPDSDCLVLYKDVIAWIPVPSPPGPASSVDADMDAKVTLTEALRRRGFYSRTDKGGRVICNFATGEPVERDELGQERTFSPQDAWEWLKLQGVK